MPVISNSITVLEFYHHLWKCSITVTKHDQQQMTNFINVWDPFKKKNINYFEITLQFSRIFLYFKLYSNMYKLSYHNKTAIFFTHTRKPLLIKTSKWCLYLFVLQTPLWTQRFISVNNVPKKQKPIIRQPLQHHLAQQWSLTQGYETSANLIESDL